MLHTGAPRIRPYGRRRPGAHPLQPEGPGGCPPAHAVLRASGLAGRGN
ncbi:hypothetical protein SFR_0634 [Streptomyces sp. FR-008]|nr:hypothetical protein SFR_0634 [Streptomyces sp. FR-008]